METKIARTRQELDKRIEHFFAKNIMTNNFLMHYRYRCGY